ncbi:MAG: hypothetical protein JSW40_04115 [Candidatus Omnitrophota bacterium]|nr:MAG: hypothetical protein JSW40_04115 [Candidatus Omnitrophota bacterium]
MKNEICQAIHEKKIVTFSYDGGTRTIEPHCYGISKSGNELLRAYQTGGYSESGKSVGWKLFSVNKISKFEVSTDTFNDSRPQYNPNDKAMSTIYCCL